MSISNGNRFLNDVITIRHDIDPPHYKIHEVSNDNPEYLSDGVFIFHNPNAKNPLPSDMFKETNAIQITVKDGGLFFEGENLPIVARFNDPMLLRVEISKNHIYQLIDEGFNG